MKLNNWSYGVTTVPERMKDLLPQTLQSLAAAGFDDPRLFVDGLAHRKTDDREYEQTFNLSTSCRNPRIRTFGNWILALWELYVRRPYADRFAIFQDDIIVSKNLRQYLDQVSYPDHGYLNLYTMPHNQPDQLAARVQDGQLTHPDLDPKTTGFYRSCGYGKGGLALVFDRRATQCLLSSPLVAQKPMDPTRGHCKVDGIVCDALKAFGIREYVHNPSLVQHTGEISTMQSRQWPKAESFRGEDFDLMSLLC